MAVKEKIFNNKLDKIVFLTKLLFKFTVGNGHIHQL